MKSTVKPVPDPVDVVAAPVPVAAYPEPPAVIEPSALTVPVETVMLTVNPDPLPPVVDRPVADLYPVPPVVTARVVATPVSGVSRVSVVVSRVDGSSRITAAVYALEFQLRTSAVLPLENVKLVPATIPAGTDENVIYWSAPRSATTTSSALPCEPAVFAANFHAGLLPLILEE